MIRTIVGAISLIVTVVPVQAQTLEVDPRIPAYTRVRGISGSASSIGSDTMNNLMALWLEGFRKYYPTVNVQIEGKGSSTAPPALIEGTAQFGPMSRAMKATEVDKFEQAFGYPPTPLRTALDALAVFVNKDNPIRGLTLQQVDAIFSKTRRRGHPDDIQRWSEAGWTGDHATALISMYGRNSASGTYGFFKKNALSKGDFKDEVKEQPGSASVVQGVAEDRFGIGYSGIGYRTSDVRVVPLADDPSDGYSDASMENVLDGTYPLGRFLFIYINKAPGRPLDPMVREFCRYIFSKEGQEVAIKDGYMPVPFEVAEEELAKLEADGM